MPGSSSSTYRQYKADTDFVASWLANTAKECGYPGDLLLPPSERGKHPQDEQKRGGRLKGKARREAKASAASETPKVASIYKIALCDFLKLAQFISNHHKRAFRVSTTFFTVIERAIKLRKEQGSMFPDHNDADEKHNHFIGILEQVQQVLLPMTAKKAREDQRATNDGSGLSNRFANLDIQETVESLQHISETTPSSAAQPKVSYKAALLEDKHEAWFSCTLLLYDLMEIHKVVMETWGLYGEGSIDLIAATLTTNTALDLVKSMEEEMRPAIDKLGGVSTFVMQTYLNLIGLDHEECPKKFMAVMNDDIYAASRSFYLPLYVYLNQFIRNFVRFNQGCSSCTGCVTYEKNMNIQHHPAIIDNDSTSLKMFLAEQEILTEGLHRLSVYMTKKTAYYAQDQLTRDIRALFETREYSFSVLFGAQVFVDIHHLLGDQVSRGHSDLMRFSEFFRAKLASDPTANADSTPTVMTEWLHTGGSASGPLDEDPREVFKWHPLLSGIWLFKLKTEFHTFGISSFMSSPQNMYACHLYNALLQENFLPGTWLDMELLLFLQGDGLFVGGRPKSCQHYAKILFLSLGCSVSVLSGDSYAWKQFKRSKKGNRGLRRLVPVTDTFQDRLFDGFDKTGFSMQDIEKMLSVSDWKQRDDHQWTKMPPMRGNQSTNKPVSSQKRLDLENLLRDLRQIVHLESLELGFDYELIQKKCSELMGGVLRTQDMDPVDLFTVDAETPTAIILCDLEDIWIHRDNKPGSAGKIPSKAILETVQVMKKYTETGAGRSVYEDMDKQPSSWRFVFSDGTFSVNGPAK